MSDDNEPVIRKTIGLSESFWAAIAEYRFENRINTEAEAVRALLWRGLAAGQGKAKGRKEG